MIREILKSDFENLLTLYMQLQGNSMPYKTYELEKLWSQIVDNKDYHIIVAEENGKIVSSCTCVIIPNLTHNQRSYAFVENVVTDINYWNKGLATQCLNYAKEIAIKENCYKMMLLTGSKKEKTLNFYRHLGYNSEDKTAFVQWI